MKRLYLFTFKSGIIKGMGYKDPDRQREYAKNWIAERRRQFFAVLNMEPDQCIKHKDAVVKIAVIGNLSV